MPPLHGLLFPISSKGVFYMDHPIERIVHTTAFVKPVVEHWLEREKKSMGPPWRINPTTHQTMSEHFYHGAISHSNAKKCHMSTLCFGEKRGKKKNTMKKHIFLLIPATSKSIKNKCDGCLWTWWWKVRYQNTSKLYIWSPTVLIDRYMLQKFCGGF